MSDVPTLTVDPFEHVWCPLHGEPFRADYPAGFPVATVQLLQAALELDDLIADAAESSPGSEAPRVEAALPALERKRACCRVTPETLLDVYRGARDDWPLELCDLCGDEAHGAPYVRDVSAEQGVAGATETFAHVCFACVVGRLRTSE